MSPNFHQLPYILKGSNKFQRRQKLFQQSPVHSKGRADEKLTEKDMQEMVHHSTESPET